MADAIIRDFLADCAALTPNEVHSFANTITDNNDLIQALFTVLEEKKYHQEFLQVVCEQLFAFYRSEEDNLHSFTLQFIPTLISIYLTAVSTAKQKNFRSVEVFLLGLYNLEVVDREGKSTIWSFRLPSTAKPSIYHEPFGASHLTLTENALNRLESGDNRLVSVGPFPEVERINASNRLIIMKLLMQVYNRHISLVSKFSHQALCRSCSRLVKQGISRQRNSLGLDNSCTPHPQASPRIPLSSEFLLEILHAVYFSMFNGLNFIGIQAIDDIHYRATLDLMADVLLVSNAIRNSLRTNPSGQPSDGPMGISVALSPTTTASTPVSKAIITNASFRTKKLPEDIPIQGSKEEVVVVSDGTVKQLTAITEEGLDEEHSPRTNSVKGKGNKLPVLQLRKKKKDASLQDTPKGSKGNSDSVLKSSLKSKSSVDGTKNLKSDSINNSSEDISSLNASLSKLPDSATSESLQAKITMEMNSINLDHSPVAVISRKSSSAFNVSNLVNNHMNSEESVASSSGHKKESENGLHKPPSAQTVV